MKNQLQSIQNINGGGLSTQITGQYTSVRHALAKENGKLTAGQAAKELTKILKTKIYAKELVEIYKLLNGCEPEWHHAGFYKSNGKSTMGRTFFFTFENLEDIVKNWDKVEILKMEREAEKKRQMETVIFGFYYIWTSDYSGNYGKKRNYKKLQWYSGNEFNTPKNFVSCSEEIYEKNKDITKSYYGWDEPIISEFQSN